MPMLGYADIALVRAPTTMLSPFAALSGLICPAIVISQFVGLAHGASRDAS